MTQSDVDEFKALCNIVFLFEKPHPTCNNFIHPSPYIHAGGVCRGRVYPVESMGLGVGQVGLNPSTTPSCLCDLEQTTHPACASLPSAIK